MFFRPSHQTKFRSVFDYSKKTHVPVLHVCSDAHEFGIGAPVLSTCKPTPRIIKSVSIFFLLRKSSPFRQLCPASNAKRCGVWRLAVRLRHKEIRIPSRHDYPCCYCKQTSSNNSINPFTQDRVNFNRSSRSGSPKIIAAIPLCSDFTFQAK